MTMILVTHDQEEAMAVSDRIFVMNNGELPKMVRQRKSIRNQIMNLLLILSVIIMFFHAKL